ncbi:MULTISPECIES: DUF742 domain-containing protein [unclassified Streptomyces]|uniref:DUF742 domain-containing protein n=2 Tax=Streptomyces TaxID=1883 RepID=A0ABU2RLE4_9ACTN|nr:MULTISPECIES: DUF742 domain-containing protein [unclassified Streptomyces]HBF84287.1 DUF742 domain-containing protein [Streptomyces sp.]AEN12920.1 protein of unknown function DUF742 [Streptomyces sp. SirexAA-E]MDT0429676.1 DUF742 domain-containing protein [Streptomyces sp. DSM 41770]MYR66085.1 DUF742 domain-containing protein [Streptomyces sp. SID4939]MYS00980.1 DUF742 domain-containing protein [Streptomyces sp. SID4940]
MTPGPGRRLIPAYLVTGGRSTPSGPALDRLAVLLRTDAELPPGAGTEQRRLCGLLDPGALTVVECAAHLELPVSATVFLATDLVASGHLRARPPIPRAGEIDRSLVERLLVGLRSLH